MRAPTPSSVLQLGSSIVGQHARLCRRTCTVTLLANSSWRHRTFATSSKLHIFQRDPLRILFCGSDEFSIASLLALDAKRRADQQDAKSVTIQSIDVLCRRAKPVGRGLKKLKEVPIKAVAEQKGLRVHEITSFTNWQLPRATGGSFDLVIAVSFGLFIPARILRAVRFGGINVHPSLLPDLRGPAPIQWSIVRGRRCMGITVQRLHETSFDRGQVLSQTAFEPLALETYAAQPSDTEVVTSLSQYMARVQLLNGIAASALMDDIVEGRYAIDTEALQPRYFSIHSLSGSDQGHFAKEELQHAPEIWFSDGTDHARTLVKGDRHVQWQHWTAAEIVTRLGAFGDLWDDVTYRSLNQHGPQRRLVFSQLAKGSLVEGPDRHMAAGSNMGIESLRPGTVCLVTASPQFSGESQSGEARYPAKTGHESSGSHETFTATHIGDDDVVKEHLVNLPRAVRGSLPGIAVSTRDGAIVMIVQCTIESERQGQGQKKLTRVLQDNIAALRAAV